MIPEIRIADFAYPLPEERIAKYPLERRDSSKLLVYKDGSVEEKIFRDLPSYLPEGSLMIFNDTRVVPARLHFQRESGAHIEIFCIKPNDPVEYNTSFSARNTCSWKCVIGNSKRWKGDTLRYFIPEGADAEEAKNLELKASLERLDTKTGIVRFDWNGDASFSDVLDICGKVPIPPYLNRDTEPIDSERYQTLYAHIRGSVAAPTAGLHFTEEVLEAIRGKSIDTENVCLHVGAGTFLPVKTETIAGHPMHREPFSVSRELIRKIRDRKGKLIAVGTTSVRTLESLYYVGASIIETGHPEDVQQWAPYERDYSYSLEETLDAIINYLDKEGIAEIKAETRIIIVPGFEFRVVDMMVTNFHQPESTLILLVSAFVGGDWKTIYDYALAHDFRFLSYGDSSLLYRR